MKRFLCLTLAVSIAFATSRETDANGRLGFVPMGPAAPMPKYHHHHQCGPMPMMWQYQPTPQQMYLNSLVQQQAYMNMMAAQQASMNPYSSQWQIYARGNFAAQQRFLNAINCSPSRMMFMTRRSTSCPNPPPPMIPPPQDNFMTKPLFSADTPKQIKPTEGFLRLQKISAAMHAERMQPYHQ